MAFSVASPLRPVGDVNLVPMPQHGMQPAAAGGDDWRSIFDDILGIAERGVDIWERVDYHERRRRHEIEMERLRQQIGQFPPAEPHPGRIEVTPVPQPLPAWVWVVAGVGAVAVVLLLVRSMKE